MKTNTSTIVISVIIVLIVIAGGWYLINQSTSASHGVATTTAATTTATATGNTVVTGSNKTITTTTHTTVTSSGTAAVPPQIIEFTPAAGAAGTQVTVEGTNFDPTTNYIIFGTTGDKFHSDGSPDNQIAVVGSTNGTSLIFTVPSTGPSGLLCDASNHCIAVSAAALVSGNYPVTIRTKGGTSNTVDFSVTK